MEETKNNQVLTKEKNGQAKNNKRRVWIVLAFLSLVVLIGYIIYRGDYLETLELGEQYLSIFWQNILYQVVTFTANFLLLFILIFWTNKRIQKGLIPFFEDEKKPMPKMLNKSIAFIVAIVVSFFITNIILKKLMLCMNATAFELLDPVLNYDISYFIFVQPFMQFILRYFMTIVVGLTIYATL